MSHRTVLLETDSLGSVTVDRPFFGLVRAIHTDPGDMDTPNIVVSDPVVGTTLRTNLAMTTDDYYQPPDPLAVFGVLRVAVTSGGDTKHGRVRLMVET